MTLATFTPPIAPSPGTTDKPKVKILKADFGDGYSQWAPDGLNNIRRTLSLTWEVLLPAQALAITSFMFTQAAAALPFYYTPSDETTAVKWTCDNWEDKRGDNGIRTVVATLEQSFALIS